MDGEGALKGRLISHAKKKADLWTHFSAYVVWDNIREEEVAELEGLFRHIYGKDSRASALNIQRKFKKLRQVPGIFSERRLIKRTAGRIPTTNPLFTK